MWRFLSSLGEEKQILVAGSGFAPSCRVYNNADISILHAVETALTFNSERSDTDLIHDTVTNSSRLTCKTAGRYLMTGHVWFAANSSGRRAVYVRLNGTTIIGRTMVPTAAAGGVALTVTATYELAVNDYLELIVYQDSGVALNVLAVLNESPEFSMAKIDGVVSVPNPLAPSYGTSLPAAPTDGLEAILVDSLTDPTYQWRFRYNAGSSSAYKWEFIGGRSAFAEATGLVSTQSATPVQLSGGPSITLPRTGLYEISWRVRFSTASNTRGYVRPYIGSTGVMSLETMLSHRYDNNVESHASDFGEALATAGEVLDLRYQAGDNIVCYWGYRRIWVRPKRVS